MDVLKAKVRYNDQMQRARARGIEWQFTYDTWVATWRNQVGPQWQAKRGREKHQYCMARKGDVGPYSPSNVECITCSQNQKDKMANGRHRVGRSNPVYGERQHMSKLTNAQVVELYQANGCIRELSVKYKVTYANVWEIRSQRSRKQQTDGLKVGTGCQCGIKGIRCALGY